MKIYLDASAEERARRRANDPAHTRQPGRAGRGRRGDRRRATRRTRRAAVSPLTLAPDAVHIDTTAMPINAVVEKVLGLVRERLAAD